MPNLKSIVAAAIIMVVLAGLIGCATLEETAMAPAPVPGTEGLTAGLVEDSIYLFADRDFRGDVARIDSVTAMPAGASHDIAGGRGISSARWNLRPGVLLVLYERPGGQGNQIALWGQGQVPSMSQWRSNDRVSQWAWYDLAARPGRPSAAAEPPRPLGATPTGAMTPGAIELYRDSGLRGTLTSIGPVTQFPGGTLHRTAAATDAMTSLRWNLPAGVVVVLYEDAEAKGRQLTLFGSGQYESVTPWNFNDKVSRWAWYDIGTGQ